MIPCAGITNRDRRLYRPAGNNGTQQFRMGLNLHLNNRARGTGRDSGGTDIRY